MNVLLFFYECFIVGVVLVKFIKQFETKDYLYHSSSYSSLVYSGPSSDSFSAFFYSFLAGLGLAFSTKYLSFAASAYLIISLFWKVASSLISVSSIEVKISLIFF